MWLLLCIIITVVYFSMGYYGYKDILENGCLEADEVIALQKIRRKIIFHWLEYAFNLGRIKRAVLLKQIQDAIEKDKNPDKLIRFPKDVFTHTCHLFSETFPEQEQLGAFLFAEYTFNLVNNDEDDTDDFDKTIWEPQQ